MTTVQEVVVKATPKGVQETTDQMDELEGSVSGIGEALKEQASGFSGVAKAFKGAMGAVVAGLAVSTGFLLSRVPVLGELFDGLVAVFDAVAFQLDQKLRPAITPVVNGLFDLSDAIFAGNWGKAQNIIASFVTRVKNLDWQSIFQTVKQVFGQIRSAIGNLNLISRFRGAIKEMFNLSKDQSILQTAVTKVKNFIVSVVKSLPGGQLAIEAGNLFITALDKLTDFAQDATQKIQNFFDELTWTAIVGTIIKKLRDKSKQLTDGIVALVRDVNWKDVGGALGTEFKDALGDAIESRVTSGVESPVPTAENTSFAEESGSSDSNDGFIGSVTGTATSIFLDGDKLNDNMGRRRKNALARRGG